MKRRILLFQPYLRHHILAFKTGLKSFEFVIDSLESFASRKTYYQAAAKATPDAEFQRTKLTLLNRFRRLFGIPNFRIKFTQKGDLLFTYGCLLITNKPYCVYIENGVTLFNYDVTIAHHPFARLLASVLIRLPQCKKLIFMSETARTSMLSTAKFSARTRAIIEKKSAQVYPLVEAPKNVKVKEFSGKINLLFTGVFYMKGGMETLEAFRRLRQKHQNVFLTVVTPINMLRPSDREALENTPGLQLINASLSKEEMEELYQNHDIFLFPTFRDTFGLVLIEASAWGMPIIATDQYATTEMAISNQNSFVFPNHPLKDYDPQTYEMFGKWYHPRDFYTELFRLQKDGSLEPLITFLVDSVEQFLINHDLLQEYSSKALSLYDQKFREDKISKKIEALFEDTLR